MLRGRVDRQYFWFYSLMCGCVCHKGDSSWVIYLVRSKLIAVDCLCTSDNCDVIKERGRDTEMMLVKHCDVVVWK